MKLRTVIDRFPALFYEQEWWRDQAFADDDNAGLLTLPSGTAPGEYLDTAGYLPFASTLAMLYVGNPDLELWENFLWTADYDDSGNRVYVAGVGQSGVETFQVHRALDYERICVVPVW